MEKIDISGGWVTLRNPKEVPERLRRPIIAQTAKAVQEMGDVTEETNMNEETLSFFNTFNDLLAIAMIAEWSFSDKVSLETLLDLTGANYDEIQKLVAPFIKDLMPDFSPSPDPKVSTVPSNG